MLQKGFAPVIIILVLALAISAGGYFVWTNREFLKAITVPTTAPTVTPGASPKTGSGIPVSITPAQTLKPTAKPTLKPTATAEAMSKSSCSISFFSTDSGQNTVMLAYGLTSVNGESMTAAQWDFEGDGKWDTDFSIQNGTLNHTYPSAGTYNVKLHLKTSSGLTTNTCSKSLTLPMGFEVSFSGKVFSDTNCNKTWDTNESFIQGATVEIIKLPEYSTFKTLTTDQGGNFSFSTRLNSGESLTINPVVKLFGDYSKVYYAPNYTLNSGTTSSSTSLSLIPTPDVANCH